MGQKVGISFKKNRIFETFKIPQTLQTLLKIKKTSQKSKNKKIK